MGSAAVAAIAVLGGLVTILTAVASAWAFLRAKQMEATLGLLSTANAELRSLVADYQAQVAELKGQVAALQSDVVLGLVTQAQEALRDAITEAIREGFRERNSG